MSSTNSINAATTSLKDTPIVVKEGNDVSRQVVKPIYPEGLDNDGPLTLNQRALKSCEAVQAGQDDVANTLVLITSVTCIAVLLCAGRLSQARGATA